MSESVLFNSAASAGTRSELSLRWNKTKTSRSSGEFIEQMQNKKNKVLQEGEMFRVSSEATQTQLAVQKVEVERRYPFDGSYYLNREPHLRCGPALLL